MFKTSTTYFLGIPALIFMAGILFSCVNDMDKIQQVTYDPKAPDEVTKNLELIYTDSGYAQVKIYAKIAESYTLPERITKLKDGLQVDFFSDEGKIVSTLTALYGEVNFSTGLMFVKDSVVLRNYEKNQSLETEELFYNQSDSTIYTDKYVIVKKEGKGVTGRGHGVRSNQSFTKYRILDPVGKIDN